MASLDRTAYPRIGKRLNAKELEAHYTLSEEECRFIRHHAHGDTGHLSLAILLKTRPPMGYFPALTEVPDQICGHLAQQLGVAEHTRLVDEVSRPATSHRYRTAVRTRLDSRPFFEGGREIVITTVRHCAQTMSDPADLISAAVEALVKANIELPAFSTLDRLVSTLRQEVHETLYQRITGTLSDEQRQTLDALLDVPKGDRLNRFSRLKQTPGPPTLKHVREWTERLVALDGILDPRPFLKDIPHTQVRQFAAEAAALESGDLRAMSAGRADATPCCSASCIRSSPIPAINSLRCSCGAFGEPGRRPWNACAPYESSTGRWKRP